MSNEPTASVPSSTAPLPGDLANLLARLTPTERTELDTLLGLNPASQPLWRPLPGPQTQALLSQADVTGFGGAAGGAKALALDTPLPTWLGWTTMGAVEAGQSLLDDRGETCRVVATSEVF